MVKNEYEKRWDEIAPADLRNEGTGPEPEGWNDDQPDTIKLAASDGVSYATHKGMLDAGVHPEQEIIEARVAKRQAGADVAGAPKGQVGTTSISSKDIDDLAKILSRRDPRMSPAAAKEMAIRMNAEKGLRVSP